MQFLTDYESDSENADGKRVSALRPVVQTALNAAPNVMVVAPQYSLSVPSAQGLCEAMNSTIDVMHAPVQGPANPFRSSGVIPGIRVSGMGQISAASLSDYTFQEQFTSFQRYGFAIDASTNEVLGDFGAYVGAQQKRDSQCAEASSSSSSSADPATKRKRTKVETLDVGDDSLGPWAPPSQSELLLQERAVALKAVAEADKHSKKMASDDAKSTAPDLEREERDKEANIHVHLGDADERRWKRGDSKFSSSAIGDATSVFHGDSLVDYQGRSWMSPPAGVRSDDGDHTSYIPKKCTKKYTGHTKGVQAIEFFPGTGHLLLSASLDGTCKLWDVYGDRNVRRTFTGHSEAVRSINLSKDGSRFLSSGFDRVIRHWDIETGKAIGTYSNATLGYQVRYYPKDNNIFLVAASDHRIHQWDARAGKLCQEYNYHLQQCNSITFFEDGAKFVSTSDDKKILVWEYDVPIPIKYIAEPDMHSIPSMSLHPGGNHLVGQSMDNKIVVYSCNDRVKIVRKKVFEGHNNSGYACQIGFSPQGTFVTSGDGLGNLLIWDWGTARVQRKFRAHDDGPTMGAIWSPLKPSLLATCGWDSVIKLWE